MTLDRDQDARRRPRRDADARPRRHRHELRARTRSTFGAGESFDAIFTAPAHTRVGGRPTTRTSSTTGRTPAADNLVAGGCGGQRTEVRVYPAGAAPRAALPQRPGPVMPDDERSHHDELRSRIAVPAPGWRSLHAPSRGLWRLAAATLPAGRAPPPRAPNRVGIVVHVCARAPSPTFDLTTQAGYINLPDGTTAYMWGYSAGRQPFQHPGPVLCVNEGDTVTIISARTTLHRRRRRSCSPARTSVRADGAPSQPEVDGSGRAHLADPVGRGRHGRHRHLQLRRRRPRHLPVRVRDRSRDPGPDGPVRRPDRAPARRAPSYAYDRADSQFNPDDGVPGSCSRRSTRT